MWQSISFVDWDSVGNTITRIKNDTSGTARGVERKDSLNGDIHGWSVECLEHDLSHFFSVSLWIQWGFGKKDWVFFWCNTKFIIESVMPDFLHIIPVGNDTVFNWVFQCENTSL